MSEDDVNRLEVKIDDLKGLVDKVLKIMNGNGKLGCIAKCNLVYMWMERQIKDCDKSRRWHKEKIISVIYHIVVSILILFIVIKIGLK